MNVLSLKRLPGLIVLLSLALLLALGTITAPTSDAIAEDKVFFGKKPAVTATEKAQQRPGLIRRLGFAAAKWQRQFNERLSSKVQQYKADGGLIPALALIFLSFLYGVFHAVGPGHGKMVTAGYFSTTRAEIRDGLLMGGLIAFTQALTAIVLVGLLVIILNIGAFDLYNNVVWIEMVAYVLIILIGLYIIWGGFTGRECHHHHHGHHHHHNHDHHHGCDHADTAGKTRTTGSRRALFLTAIGTGLRPCTGAILVLLFTLTQGVFFLGVLSVFAMSAGVALSTILVSVLTILIRRLVASSVRPRPGIRDFIHRTVGVLGGLMIGFVGLLLFWGAAERAGLFV